MFGCGRPISVGARLMLGYECLDFVSPPVRWERRTRLPLGAAEIIPQAWRCAARGRDYSPGIALIVQVNQFSSPICAAIQAFLAMLKLNASAIAQCHSPPAVAVGRDKVVYSGRELRDGAGPRSQRVCARQSLRQASRPREACPPLETRPGAATQNAAPTAARRMRENARNTTKMRPKGAT